ncbi:MAG: 2,4-dihydroxyhept-2-ene-1,7-dioic acid aldolase [Chloroflexi bacterium]|nr:2,4-dihydroxyhept-2-ene-1,7-dioic acid aldolase [Chloroflexota bacterium]
MRRNKLREMLKAGQPTLGTHLHSTWPSVVEAVGHSGMFDYVEFVAEYAPFDLYALDNFCRAVELFDLSAMIKVDQEPRRFLAQRAIGAGFQSVLFADCRTVEDARECIRAVRPETPDGGGYHGVGTRRSSYMTYGGTPDYVQALSEVVVVLMIEKQSAVERLEDILSLDGIDMIQWGPVDYSMSVGRPGQWRSPEIKAVERRVFETCLRMGVPPRAEINSPDEAQYFLDMGVRHFCIGTDLFVLYDWMKTNGEKMKRALAGE